MIKRWPKNAPPNGFCISIWRGSGALFTRLLTSVTWCHRLGHTSAENLLFIWLHFSVVVFIWCFVIMKCFFLGRDWFLLGSPAEKDSGTHWHRRPRRPRRHHLFQRHLTLQQICYNSSSVPVGPPPPLVLFDGLLPYFLNPNQITITTDPDNNHTVKWSYGGEPVARWVRQVTTNDRQCGSLTGHRMVQKINPVGSKGSHLGRTGEIWWNHRTT